MRKVRISLMIGGKLRYRDIDDTPENWGFIKKGLANFVEYIWYIEEPAGAIP